MNRDLVLAPAPSNTAREGTDRLPRGCQSREQTARRARLHVLLAAALLVVAGFLLFWKLGATGFHNGDEARYAQSAREMIESGDYMTVHHRGEPFLEKPPGKIWLVALGYSLFGFNEFGARFSSALFALGAIALTLLLGRALFGTTVGLLAGTILLSSTQFIHEHCGRTAECEPELTFLYVLSFICLWKALRDGRWLFGLAAGLGLMTLVKGPLVAPLVVVSLLYLLMTPAQNVASPRVVIPAVLLFLAITLPWHIHQVLTHGAVFKRVYLDAHIVGRFTGSPPPDLAATVGGLRSGQHATYYPKVVFLSMFPWSLLLIPALMHLASNVIRRSGSAERLLLLWIAVFGLVITLSRGKLHWYVIPMLPALALCVARFCHALFRLKSGRALVVLAAAAILLSSAFLPSPYYDPYARNATQWLTFDRNLLPVWALRVSASLSWIPLLVTCGLIATLIGWALWCLGRGKSEWDYRGALCRVLVGSLLFSGLYHAALPLRGVENKRELARCACAMQAARIEPEGILIVGRMIGEHALSRRNYVYLHSLTAAKGGDVVTRNDIRDAASDPAFVRTGTLILADSHLTPRLSRLHPGAHLWRGRAIDAFYVCRRPSHRPKRDFP